jgi:hypothetical protein
MEKALVNVTEVRVSVCTNTHVHTYMYIGNERGNFMLLGSCTSKIPSYMSLKSCLLQVASSLAFYGADLVEPVLPNHYRILEGSCWEASLGPLLSCMSL